MKKRFSLRGMPADLYNKLKARARRNHRSMTAEVLAILEVALKDEAEPPPPPPRDDDDSSDDRGPSSPPEYRRDDGDDVEVMANW